ncbi:MAG: cysteine desulfurase [bacterium]|nr:cysteine desulfurase [bacterium]
MNRNDFPLITNNNIIYFDNGATTLKPRCVINEITKYYESYSTNAHRGDYKLSHITDKLYEETRNKVKDFINAKNSKEIIFTKGTTESLNLVAFGYFLNQLSPKDEIILTKSEHASNLLPWYILKKKLNIVIKYIELDSNYHVSIKQIEKIITDKTKVISLAHITNVIGDIRPIKEIVKLAHQHNIKVVVDAAQSIAHEIIDVTDLDVDFLAFSAHKMYGPTGVGILYAKEELLQNTQPLNYGGGMNSNFFEDGIINYKDIPTIFEAGTPDIASILGFGATIDFINKIGMINIKKHEQDLKNYLLKKLKELDFITIYNEEADAPIIAFNINNVFSQDTAIYLDKYNICVRAGNHCAKILKSLISINNTCRISLALYNTKDEIDLLINVLKNYKNIYQEIL